MVIIGGGLTGIEIAYDQALTGKEVNVVEVLPEILSKKEDLCAANENMLRMAIEQYHIGIHTDTQIVQISEDSVTIEKDGKQTVLPSDTVISSIGYISEHSLAEQLEDCGVQFETLGDCDHVSNLMGAIWKAFESASKI